jgi:hypothetical protein
MSLRFFHILFISLCVLMSLFVGGWGVQQYLGQQSLGGLVLGISCFLLGFGLIVYGVKVYAKLKELG